MNPTEFGHSISFVAQDGTTKNTWENWGLIADSRPTLSAPSPKTNIFDDVKMINGDIDLTYSIVPYPLYSNREGSFTFIYNPIFQSLYDKEQNWVDLYSEIMRFIHGRNLQMILEDDDDYYYEGRFHVEDWTSNNDGSGSTITIGYSVYPYKKSINEITAIVKMVSWPTNSNNFKPKNEYTDGQWNSTGKKYLSDVGQAPIIPTIYWKPYYDSGWEEPAASDKIRFYRSLTVKYVNPELGIDYGSPGILNKYLDPLNVITSPNVIPFGYQNTTDQGYYKFKDLDMLFYSTKNNTNYLQFIGYGYVKIKFQEGKL